MAASKADYVALARSKAAEAGIPDNLIPLFLGQIEQESGWNPTIKSKAGAVGLGQLMPGTARDLGVKDRTNPSENLGGAARYFKMLLDRYGDPSMALAAYNWGFGNVDKLVAKPNSVRPPKETLDYVPSVMRRALAYGSDVAPTQLAMAAFPGTGQVPRLAIDKAVAQRLGKDDQEGIERQIGLGSTPTGEKLSLPQVADAGVPTEGEPQAPAGSAMEALAAARPEIAGSYMKKQFGPLAKVADPFPRGYDQQLLDLIDGA